MEIKDEIQQILDSLLYPLGIHSHFNKRGDNVGDEYVIYNFVSSKYTDYANNQPILQRYNIDVKYYATKESFQMDRVDSIISAMNIAGMKIFEPLMPLVDDDKTVGIVVEFAKEQVV